MSRCVKGAGVVSLERRAERQQQPLKQAGVYVGSGQERLLLSDAERKQLCTPSALSAQDSVIGGDESPPKQASLPDETEDLGRATTAMSTLSCLKLTEQGITNQSRRSMASKAKKSIQLAIMCNDLQSLESESTRQWPKSFFRNVRGWLEWWLDLEEPPRTDRLANVVQSKTFETVFAFAIIAQAVAITHTINQDMINLGSTSRFDVLDWIFMGIFSVELGLRLAVHQLYFFTGGDWTWNMFDATLVVSSMYVNLFPILLSVDTGKMSFLSSLRIMKIVRVFRVLRVIRIFPGLEAMLNFVIRSGLSLTWSFAMLAFFFYLFGLILVQDLAVNMSALSDPELLAEVRAIFGTVDVTMFTILRAVFSGDDWDKYYHIIKQVNPLTASWFVCFICFVHVSLFNVITAMYVMSADNLAKANRAALANEETVKLCEKYNQIEGLCKRLDEDDSNTISRAELYKGLENENISSEFALCGLDIHDAEDFFELLLEMSNDSEVDVKTFVQACMRMQGAASGIHQHTQLLEARRFQSQVGEHFFRIKHWQNEVTQKLNELCELRDTAENGCTQESARSIR